MRYIWVHILYPDGNTKWKMIPWGKRYLDEVRQEGVIINYHE